MLLPTALALLMASDLAQAGAPGLAAVSEPEIRADIRFLSDDLLEGRRSGEPGHAIATRYVAARMEALGLQPAGADGGYFQPVRLRELRADPAGSSITVLDKEGGAGESLRIPEEASVAADLSRDVAEVEAPAVFVGYALCSRSGTAGGPRDLEGRLA